MTLADQNRADLDFNKTKFDNRTKLANEIGAEKINWLKLDHTNKIANSESDLNHSYDGFFLNEPNKTVAFTTADCLPITIISPKNKEIALVHAGWRGLVSEIVENAIIELCKNGNSEDFFVWIGPSITQNYEIEKEVKEKIQATSGAKNTHFIQKSETKFTVDLSQIAKEKMIKMSIPKPNIYITKGSTNEEKTLHSFRRDGELSGRMATVATIFVD